MKLEIRKFLYDIKESIESIENYLGEKKDFNIYIANKMLRRAEKRNLRLLVKQ